MLRAFLFLALLLAISPAHSKILDRVVAIVNDDAITLSELETFLGPTLQKIESMNDPIERERLRERQTRQALDQLIDSMLILQEAKANRVQPREEEVDAYLEQLAARQHATKEQLLAYLEHQGMLESEFRQNIRDQLARQQITHRVIGPKIRLSDGDLHEYYKEKLTQANVEFEVSAAQLLLPVAPNASAAEDAAIKAEILELKARAESGESFADLVRRYSRGPGAESGGELGHVRRGSLPEFESVLFTTEPGSIGGPIKTRYGYHIFAIHARHPLPVAGFEDSEQELRQELSMKKFQDELIKWTASLKEKAFIELRL